MAISSDAEAIRAYAVKANEISYFIMESLQQHAGEAPLSFDQVFAERHLALLSELAKLKQPALLAGYRACKNFDSVSSWLDTCARLFVDSFNSHRRLGSWEAYTTILPELNQALGKLSDLAQLAEATSQLALEKSERPVSPDTKRRNEERDAEVVRLKKEKPNRTAGQIAALIRETPDWTTMENGKPFSAGAAKAILQRARKAGELP